MALIAFFSAIMAVGPLVVWVGAVGTTRYVDDNTCPATGSGTLANPYCKIQDAICAAVSGDSVSVAPGSYTESLRMRPGVSVVSQGGPSVTTINGAGQPCTDTNFCTKKAGNQCSVVIFSTGHTTSTAISGFTITGGGGTVQTVEVGGGGIFVFSSPTISNNVITNNALAGPRAKFYGGGIYVSVGAPIITGNTITGNRAVPAPGTSGAPTYGYGGGIYVAFNTNPTITNNIISSNVAGDPNLAFSLGGGGGIAIFPGDANHPGPLIDRNTITDNQTDTMGGGVDLSSIVGGAAQAIISNNVIVGNTALYGGGMYTYKTQLKSVNNTIVDNEGKFGGGVYSGQSDPTHPVLIANNVIVGNRLRLAGDGGGIYTLDFSTTFDPNIEANDFFNNQRDNIAGDKTDAAVIGLKGNFLADPNFVSLTGRNFHLNNNSPAIDTAFAAHAPAVDRDNLPRGIDGTGTPNSPQPGDNDVGAYEWRQPCVPTTEICDGLDNNCNGSVDEGNPGGGLTCGTGLQGVCSAGTTACQSGAIVCNQNVQPSAEVCDNLDNNCNGSVDEGNPGGGVSCNTGQFGVCAAGTTACQGGSLVCNRNTSPSTEICDNLDNNCDGSVDEGFPNFDGDALADCVDPDDDNDGALDGADCAPLDGTSFGVPVAVSNVNAANGSPTVITYNIQNIGSGTRYQIVSGILSRLAITQGFAEDFCVAANSTSGTWQDQRPSPPPENAWYYMIRSVNNCGIGTYGGPLIDQPRPSGACVSGIVDADNDGSPSDLDCNDGDPNIAPYKTEICDGRDNNCVNGIDEGNPGGGFVCGSSVGECRTGLTNCQSGSIACTGFVGPGPEYCDGKDNDCDGIIDDNVIDTDHDGLNDCVDTDDDNDGVLDTSDCAPLDAGSFGFPTEVQNLHSLDTVPTQLTWTGQAIGVATQYEIGSGVMTASGSITFSTGSCLPSVSDSPATDSRPAPSPGQAYYYMVKSRNACGPGTFGNAARNTHPACP